MISRASRGLGPLLAPFFHELFGGAIARYEHLPIYKKAMDLTIYFEKIVRG